MKPMLELAAILETPPAQAEALLLDVQPGPTGRIRLLSDDPVPVAGGPEHFTVTRDGYTLNVFLDRPNRTIATQGGWWYRGEYAITQSGPHTRLTHRVLNVAGPASRWAVPLANRFFLGFADRTRRDFAESVSTFGARLNCRTRLLP